MNDSRDFHDAESIRSGNSHVTSQPVSFPPHQIPEGMLSRSKGMSSRRNGPPSIWDMVYRETFLQTQQRLLQHLFRKSPIHGSPMYQNTHHHMRWVKAKHQFRIRDASQDRQPERNSVIPSEGGFSKNYEADQQRLQISDPHFDKFSTPATFACWKISFKTEVCTCSQFPTDLSGIDSHPVPVSSSHVERTERGDPLYSDILEWLQEFRENLVDDRVPEHRDSHASSSHEVSSEPTPTRSVDLGKHSV